MSKIAEILNDCQRTFASHKKGLASLRKIQQKNPDKFAEEFIPCVNRLLTVYKREPAVERLIQLTVHFATFVENNTHPNEDFAVFLIGYLLEYTNVSEKAVRFRSSQLIALIINALNDDAELEYV
jgi:condensin complex subunit 3